MLFMKNVESYCGNRGIYQIKNFSGFYAEAIGGFAVPELPSDRDYYSNQKKNENYVYGASVGMDIDIPASSWLVGVEAGYINFGRTKYPNAGDENYTLAIKSSGWQALGKLTYLVRSGWYGFLKAGTTYTTVTTSRDVPTIDVNKLRYQKFLPTVATGIGLIICYNTTFAIEYQHLFGNEWRKSSPYTYNTPFTQDVITINLGYKFNLGA